MLIATAAKVLSGIPVVVGRWKGDRGGVGAGGEKKKADRNRVKGRK